MDTTILTYWQDFSATFQEPNNSQAQKLTKARVGVKLTIAAIRKAGLCFLITARTEQMMSSKKLRAPVRKTAASLK